MERAETIERARNAVLDYGAPFVALFACLGYLACVLYAAVFQWPVDFGA